MRSSKWLIGKTTASKGMVSDLLLVTDCSSASSVKLTAYLSDRPLRSGGGRFAI